MSLKGCSFYFRIYFPRNSRDNEFSCIKELILRVISRIHEYLFLRSLATSLKVWKERETWNTEVIKVDNITGNMNQVQLKVEMEYADSYAYFPGGFQVGFVDRYWN
jgi:hypothetical protein